MKKYQKELEIKLHDPERLLLSMIGRKDVEVMLNKYLYDKGKTTMLINVNASSSGFRQIVLKIQERYSRGMTIYYRPKGYPISSSWLYFVLQVEPCKALHIVTMMCLQSFMASENYIGLRKYDNGSGSFLKGKHLSDMLEDDIIINTKLEERNNDGNSTFIEISSNATLTITPCRLGHLKIITHGADSKIILGMTAFALPIYLPISFLRLSQEARSKYLRLSVYFIRSNYSWCFGKQETAKLTYKIHTTAQYLADYYPNNRIQQIHMQCFDSNFKCGQCRHFITWYEARQDCKSKRMDLPSVNSISDLHNIYSNIIDHTGTGYKIKQHNTEHFYDSSRCSYWTTAIYIGLNMVQ